MISKVKMHLKIMGVILLQPRTFPIHTGMCELYHVLASFLERFFLFHLNLVHKPKVTIKWQNIWTINYNIHYFILLHTL
jgi:hypothetical protein